MDLDPRFQWSEITVFGQVEPVWIRGTCNHLTPVPVTISSGETVARLCPDCDTQLPPGSP